MTKQPKTLSALKSSLLAEWYKLAKESMRDGEAMVDEFGFSSFLDKALDQVAVATAKKCQPKGMKAWASFGSHNGIFMFETGPVGSKYPTLLWVFRDKISDDLTPVIIYKQSHKGKKWLGEVK